MTKTKTIVIPEQWSEVKYKDYYRFIQAIEGQEEDNEVVMSMALQYLCGLNVEDYYALPTSTFNSITTDITNLISNQDKQPLVTSFNIEGLEYRLDPNIENMSYGMYLDLTTYSKELWKNIPIICSILYRPLNQKVGDNYNVSPYNGTDDVTIQVFKEVLTMDMVLGVVGFFLLLQKDLLKTTLTSSLKGIEKQLTTQQLETLQLNGVNTKQLLHSLEEISSNLMK